MKKWRGGGTPIGGWLYGDPGKMAHVFYFSWVHMWKWRKAYDFLRLRIHSIAEWDIRDQNYGVIYLILGLLIREGADSNRKGICDR